MSEQDQKTAQQAAELESLANNATEDESLSGDWQPGEESQAKSMSSADIIAPLLLTTFTMLSKIRGQHWAISEEIASEAAREYGNCLDHYFPDFQGAPWVGAVMVSGMLFGPPLMAEAEIKRYREQAEKQNTAKETGGDDADKSE